MTTERQKRANLANAEKSTGPRSPAGRDRSSMNAQKHGLTALPPWGDVEKWLRVILEDPDAAPDPSAREDRPRAALRLAEAEAQLQRCHQAEGAHLLRTLEHGPRPPPNDAASGTLRDRLGIDALKLMAERRAAPPPKGAAEDRPAGLRATMRTLRRYRRSAEARRGKALAAWILCEG